MLLLQASGCVLAAACLAFFMLARHLKLKRPAAERCGVAGYAAQGASHAAKRSGVFRHWPYPASAASFQESGCVPEPACLWISSLQKATRLPESRKARRLAGSKQLCSKSGPASSNIAAGAMAVERIACSGAMTGRSAVQWRAMQRGGGSGAKRSCRTERSGGRPLRSSSLLVV